jgi:undecaprenyl-diphosphatase
VRLELWQAVILGLVEGITEFLPVSSTGHLILASSLMGLDQDAQTKQAIDAFNIVIQGGAILAVLALYRSAVARMIRGLLGRDPQGRALAINLFIAFLPSALVGLKLDDWLEARLFHPGPVLAAILLGGVYMLVMDLWSTGRLTRPRPMVHEKTIYDVTPGEALVVGLLQCLALIPGTSRSLMTITGSMVVGLRPRHAAEFSFLLGMPTLVAATLYRLLKNLAESRANGTPNLFEQLGVVPCIVGAAVAMISAWAAVRWLVTFLSRHGLGLFGWYRIGLFLVLMMLWRVGVVEIERADAPVQPPAPAAVPGLRWQGESP